jgi:DNA repair exonuclease SbcCD ATPase subunit
VKYSVTTPSNITEHSCNALNHKYLLLLSELGRSRLELARDLPRSNDRLWVSEQQTNSCILGLVSSHGQKLLQLQHDDPPDSPLILLSAYEQDFIQPISRLIGYDKADNILIERALWPILKILEGYQEGHLPEAFNPLVFSLQSQFLSLSTDCPYRVYGVVVGQSAREIARLSKERFDLECSLQHLQGLLKGDKAIEQMQISALQQTLTETQEKLELSQSVHQKREEGLQAALEESRAHLAKTQTLHQQRESDLQTALDKSNRSAEENRLRTEAEIVALQEQIRQHESHQQQLQREKSELATCAQAEATRASKLDQKAQLLAKERRQLRNELEAIQEASEDAEVQHQITLLSLSEELEQARHVNHELEETLKQVRAESQAQHEQLNQALEAEKQQASKEQIRLNAVNRGLNTQLEATRAKSQERRKKLFALKALLVKQQQSAQNLLRSLKTANAKTETKKKHLAEAEQAQRKLLDELQQEHKSRNEAWKKASESDLAMQEAKLELAFFKDGREQEICNLRAMLEHQEAMLKQQQESSDATQAQYIEENQRRQISLTESQGALKRAEANIRSLKTEQQSLHEANSKLERQLLLLKTKSQAKQAQLTVAIESGRQEIASLLQKLNAANAQRQSRKGRKAFARHCGKRKMLKRRLRLFLH